MMVSLIVDTLLDSSARIRMSRGNHSLSQPKAIRRARLSHTATDGSLKQDMHGRCQNRSQDVLSSTRHLTVMLACLKTQILNEQFPGSGIRMGYPKQ